MEDHKLELRLSVVSLLRILALLAWICGLAYTIFSASDYADHTFGTTEELLSIIFFGLMWTLLSGGVLYALASIVCLIQGLRQSQIASNESKAPNEDKAAP